MRKVLVLAVVLIVVGLLSRQSWLGEPERLISPGTGPAAGSATHPGTTVESQRAPAPASPAAHRVSAGAHKTPPSELPAGPVRNYLPGLLASAAGPQPSAAAAFKAFQALNACRFRHSHPTQKRPDDSKPGAQDCEGITETDWKDAPRLLELAAELGNEHAQIAYATKDALDGTRIEDLFPTTEDLVAFRSNATRYLVDATEAGNVDAMWFLSEAFRNGDLGRKDLALAYTYKTAISRTGAYPAQFMANDLSAFAGELTPEQVRIAEEGADKLLARCCREAASGK